MKQIKKILQVILPLALAGLLFWWVYRDWNFQALADAFRSGVHYEWFIVSLLLSILSMVLRGLRWQQLLDPVCPGARKSVTILSIFVGYAANMLFPRAGEVARCGILKKVDGISFTKSLGTVITERVFDVICLLVITLLAVFLQVDVFRDFFTKNPDSLAKWQGLLASPYLWGAFIAFVVLVVLLWRPIRKLPFYGKARDLILHLWVGMKSITTLQHPILFIFYSIAIWGCYFLMFCIVKYFFTWDMPLGILVLLSGFVMGSFGVVAPVQGGIGAYHFMVIYTLVFYGISSTDAGIYALVAHGLQAIFTLVTGLIAYVWVQFIGRTKPFSSGDSVENP
jgi:glycosyltransferase 2 family protein